MQLSFQIHTFPDFWLRERGIGAEMGWSGWTLEQQLSTLQYFAAGSTGFNAVLILSRFSVSIIKHRFNYSFNRLRFPPRIFSDIVIRGLGICFQSDTIGNKISYFTGIDKINRFLLFSSNATLHQNWFLCELLRCAFQNEMSFSVILYWCHAYFIFAFSLWIHYWFPGL